MANLRPIPNQGVPVTLPDGRMNPPWYEYFLSRERAGIANLSDVDTTAPANGEVLVFDSGIGKWTPGAN
jgi:hypothetical protein